MNDLEQKLFDLAVAHLKDAYAPYSKFHVGAALMTASGKIILGVNIENSSYGATNCAERTALFSWVNQGLTNDPIKCLLITGNTDRPISPCGICRQVMTEFMAPDTPVILTNVKCDFIRSTVDRLIPYHFTEDDLAAGTNK